MRPKLCKWLVIAMVLAVTIPAPRVVEAQQSGAPKSDPPQTAVPQPEVRIISASRVEDGAPKAGLGDEIEVQVDGFDRVPNATSRKWILFLNGIALTGIENENADIADGKLRFFLRREGLDPATREASLLAWKALLRGWTWSRPVTVALGTSQQGIEPTIQPLANKFQLIVVPRSVRFILSLVLAIAVAGAVISLGYNSNLLRDPPVIPLDPGVRPPFSLGRVQWAWWILLILTGYLAIGLVTWDYVNVFSTTALTLLGISTGTAFGAGMIGGGQATRRATLKQDVAGLEAQTQAATDPNTKEKLRVEFAKRNSELEKLDARLQQGTQGFILDILSDEHGVSLHRFQIVIWTVSGAICTRRRIRFNKINKSTWCIQSRTCVDHCFRGHEGFDMPTTARTRTIRAATAEISEFRKAMRRWAKLWGAAALVETSVEWSPRLSRSVGRAYPQRMLIRLHVGLREPRHASLLREVLCHEAAHLAVFILHGRHRSRRPYRSAGSSRRSATSRV